MAANPFDSLVQIFVPTGKSHGINATGYPIGENLILTARHVLYPKDRDPDRKIEVRFYYREDRQWLPVESIPWEGGEALDCALIRVIFPPGVRPPGTLSLTPASEGRWRSKGFARAGLRDDGACPAIGLEGQILPTATGESLNLGADYKADDPEEWRGISGSPVFLHGKVVGVIHSCPPNFAGRRLTATPVCNLAKDPGFLNVFPLDDPAKVREVVRRAGAILSSAREAIAVLERLLELDGAIEGKKAEFRAEKVVSRLVHEDAPSLINVLDRGHALLCQKEAPPKDRVALVRVANLLIPIAFDQGIVGAARYQVNTGAILIGLPAATRTVAEVIMAGADRRRTSFRTPKAARPEEHDGIQLGLDPPTSHWDISSEPEAGIDFSGKGFAEQIHQMLAAQFLSAADRSVFTNPMDRRELVREQLERIRKDLDNGGTYYLVLQKSQQSPQTDWSAAIQELNEAYPALAIVELRDYDLKLRLQENDLVWPISQILWRQQTATRGQDASRQAT